MKYISTSMFFYVSVVVLIGLTLADEEGGDITTEASSQVVGHACEIDRTGHTVNEDDDDILMDRLLACYTPEGSNHLKDLQTANTTEEFRDAMKGYCDQLGTINSCIVGVTTLVGQCLVNDSLRSFTVVSNAIDDMLSVACHEDGVKVANITEELRNLRNASEQRSFLDKCLDLPSGALGELDGDTASGVSVAYYRIFQTVKGCLLEAGEGHPTLINTIDTTFDEILKKLKCIHPDTNVEVLCETFLDH